MREGSGESTSEAPVESKIKTPKKTLAIAVVAVVLVVIVLLAVVMSPQYSPLSSVHDADGDGVADDEDAFPDDPSRTDRLSITITMTKEFLINEFYRYCVFDVDSVEGGRIPLTEVYVVVNNADGSVGLPKTQLNAMVTVSWTLYGVSFFNIQDENMVYLDSLDSFTMNLDKYDYGSTLTLTNEFDEIYCSYSV